MSEHKYQIIRRFGPSVLKIKIPQDVVDNLNNYIDNLIKDDSKSKKLNYGEYLVGDVTQEFLLEKEIIKESGWLNFLSTCAQKWIEVETGKKISKFALKQSWIVRQFKNEYNPIHYHSGSLSGVGYLKVPKNFTKSKKKSKTNGTIDFIHGSRSFLNKSIFNHKPKEGDMIIFPNYLMHTVYPFNVDGERRSFSFNIDIDKKILEKING